MEFNSNDRRSSSSERTNDVQISKLVQGQKILRSEMKNLRLKVEAWKRNHEKEMAKMRVNLIRDVSGQLAMMSSNCPPIVDVPDRENSQDPSADAAVVSGTADVQCWPLRPIGHIKSMFKKKNATPRQASIVDATTARLRLERRRADDLPSMSNPNHTIDGLDEFSHVWLIFVFHENGKNWARAKVAPPRLDGRRVGVFSTRSPHRPNPIGLSLAKLDSVEDDTLYLSGVDLLDGTPVVDIKPYIPQYDSPDWCRVERPLAPVESESTSKHQNEREQSTSSSVTTSTSMSISTSTSMSTCQSKIKIPSWIADPPIKKLDVRFTERAAEQLAEACRKESSPSMSEDTMRRSLVNILAEDTRSVYRRNRCQDRLYFFVFGFLHVTSWFDDDCGVVEVLRIRHRVEEANKDAEKQEITREDD